jgi:SAM-dependent methyltransferase
METFGIDPSYRANSLAPGLGVRPTAGYWNAERIRNAAWYQYPVYQFAARLIARRGVSRVVDVGCGPGIKLASLHARFPRVEFVGIDQGEAIEFCLKTHPFGQWLVDDFDRPTTTAPTGDLVICSDVIEHVENPDTLLAYLKARLRPGGYLLLSTPDRDALHGVGCRECLNASHVREWNVQEFGRYVASRGFRILDHRRQYPVKVGLNGLFLRIVRRRLVAGRPLKYNQVCLVEVA